MTRMVRVNTARGYDRIHLRACHMARRGRAEDWPAGDNRTAAQLSIDGARLGFRPCRVCQPFPAPNPAKLPGYQRPSSVVVELGSAEPQIGVV